VGAVFYPVALNVIPMKRKQKPAKKSRPSIEPTAQNERLKGWNEIAFLGQPVAAAERWARSEVGFSGIGIGGKPGTGRLSPVFVSSVHAFPAGLKPRVL
jgi:hypothetical protein